MSSLTTAIPSIPTSSSSEEIKQWTRMEELQKIRSTFHAKEILTCNRNTVQCTFVCSSWRRATIRFHMRDNYPEKTAIVELEAPMLANGVVKKLLKACESRVVLCAKSNDMQVVNTATYLKEMIKDNLLLPCIDEVRKESKQAIQNQTCKNVVLSEKTGLVRLDLQNELYSITVDLKVPTDYPSEEPKVIFRKSNFPITLTSIYHAQVSEIVRRCSLGYSEQQAMRGSDGLKRPPKQNRKNVPLSKVRVTTEKLTQLKSDVKVLKKIVDLRKGSKMSKEKANQYTQQRNRRALNEGNESARRARRELRDLVKDETKKEDKWQAEEAKMNAIEDGLLILNASDILPTRSVGLAIKFIINQFVGRLPNEICQGCNKILLAPNPNDAKGLFDKKSKQRARRVYCGHFWHTDCLHKCLTLPPFGMQGCPGCAKDDEGGELVRIWHHEWSRDIKKHEKAWSNKMAREREIQEVQDIFGFNSDDFEEEEEEEEEEDDDDD
jgi:hypothetical protein